MWGLPMRFAYFAAVVLAACLPDAAMAEDVGIKTYPISGSTGFELYESIGRNGPKGAVAETRYTLTWQRLFDEEGGDCRLVRLRPRLTITKVVPKPRGSLPPALQRKWDVFIDGVHRHEDQHVRMLREMVAATQAAAAGAVVENDPTCAKVKKKVTRHIDDGVASYKANSRAFDREELSDGGNVHRLILGLVND